MKLWRSASRGVAAVVVALTAAACGPGAGGSASHGATIPVTRSSAPTTAPAGGSGTAANVLAVMDVVEKRTRGVHSAKVDMTMSMGETVTTSSKGEMDWSHGIRSTMTTTYTGGTAAEGLKSAGVSGPLQARFLADGYYTNLGPAMAARLGGKHWIYYSYDALAKISGAGALLRNQSQNGNPIQTVQSALASKDLRKVGTETVRGVRADHYAGAIDVAALGRQLSTGMTSAQLARLQKTLADAGVSSEKVDLWIGADHLPVKAVSSAVMKTGTMHATIYYSDFGLPVRVTAPPASDCVDFSDLTKAAGKTS